MSFDDYRINAQVRQLLVRRGVELSKIEHGVTNSVIYIKGNLSSFLSGNSDDPDRIRQEEAVLAAKLEKALRMLPGVRDVVFHLDRLIKVGRKWKRR